MQPSSPGSARTAGLALLVVTVVWGWTFTWMKQGLDAAADILGEDRKAVAVGLFLAMRFGLAALLLPFFVPAARRGLGRAVSGGLLSGGLLLAGFLLQMFGLTGVSPPVSAFLTSLYVVFTALILAVRRRRLPGPALLAGVVLATLGAGFIQGPPQLTFGLPEALTVVAALVFAGHILVTDAVTRRQPPMAVTWISFHVVTAGGVLVLTVGAWRQGLPGHGLAELCRRPDFVGPLAATALLATVLALSLMNHFQRRVDPVRAAILYAVEPVWATLAALTTGRAAWSPWLLLGGCALLAGNLVAELGPLLRRR